MDKKRFLTFASFSFYGITFVILTVIIFLWWIFFYQPLCAQIDLLDRSNKFDCQKIKQRPFFNKKLLQVRAEILHLNCKKKEFPKKGFSQNKLSQEVLFLASHSDATVSFFRVKPWREKNDFRLCEAEIAILGLHASCCAFLKNLNEHGAEVISITLKSREDDLIELAVLCKIYECKDEYEKNIVSKKDFESFLNIFSHSLKKDKKKQVPKNNNLQKFQKLTEEKKSSRSMWIDISDVPQISYQENFKDYRVRNASKNTVVV